MHLAKVLVAVDFSDESKKALCYAVAFARQFGSSVTLFHVVAPIACEADYGYGPVTRKFPDQEMLGKARRRLKALGKRLIGCGLEFEMVVLSGAAHGEIIRAARELHIDLIIIGTHGICASENAPTDSTTLPVVRDAPCPVFVVRKKEHEFVWPTRTK